MNHFDFRRLRRRDLAVIAALPAAIGLPFLWVQHLLFRPAGPVLTLLSPFILSPDALTAAVMAAYCFVFGFALLAGHFFLRRFLSR